MDFVNTWSAKTGIAVTRFIVWLGLASSKFYAWRQRYGKVNEHNGWIPRDFWLEPWEREAILAYYDAHPQEGYRRLTFMMLDENVVAVSPTTVWRVLNHAGRLRRWGTTTSKGMGFQQPLTPHEHWHIDVSYVNICGTFYYLCSLLDGCSRYIVHWDLRESMTEADIEIVLQKARELYPEARPRVISGVVKDIDGNPVESADVLGQSKEWMDRTVSMADGSFMLAGLQRPYNVTLSASLGERSSLKTVVDVSRDGLSGVELVLSETRGACVVGRVVDPIGKPMQVRLTAWGQDPGAVSPSVAVSNSALDNLTIRLVPGESALTGTVLTADKRPVAGAAVFTMRVPGPPEFFLHDSAATSNDDGTFRVTGLFQAPLTVTAFHPTFGTGSTVVEIGRAPATCAITLQPPGHVHGQVTSDGEPVVGINVLLTNNSGSLRNAMTQDDGIYQFDDVEAGPAVVTVNVPENFAGSGNLSQELEMTPGQTNVVDFDLIHSPANVTAAN